MVDARRERGSGGVRLEAADDRDHLPNSNQADKPAISLAEALTVGDEAPDFELPAVVGGVRKKFRLSQHRKQRNVVLAFYPFNWQESSARQIIEYQAQRSKLQEAGGEVAGVTVDSIMNITAWEREIGPIDFPLCSDFWPHGEVSGRYGVLQTSGDSAGAAEHATFIVDRDGRIAFAQRYGPESVPAIEDFLQVLEKL